MITARQRDVLGSLAVQSDWTTPQWIGGWDGSHHSQTLRQLVKKGLAEVKKLHAIYCYHGTHHVLNTVTGEVVYVAKAITRCCCKGSCRYRITKTGRRVLRRAQKVSTTTGSGRGQPAPTKRSKGRTRPVRARARRPATLQIRTALRSAIAVRPRRRRVVS